ncbi:pentatricopeptide repeat-containing protein At3g47530 [Cornus florida]|uniref:pentatricopeptide repeat-containing protein At3g47530 n=1 Tax=Cornus florida TaxID=4283 RepID=UPI00289ED73F|nr:pentatricopeptide repeat-containing protein At3g47530 [Cornus florida]
MTAISHHLHSYRSSLSNLNSHYRLSPRFASASASHLHRPPCQAFHNPQQLALIKPTIQLLSTGQTEKTLISLIKSCSSKTQLLQIHAHLVRTSLLQDPTISLTFLIRVALWTSRNFGYSRRIFSHISEPNVSHYNTMIRACLKNNSPEEGFKLYREMQWRGMRPDPLSSSFAIKSCVKISSLFGGLQIHARVLRDGHQSDRLLLTTLMDLYSTCRKCDEACKVFDEISERDAVTWNVLISCYTRNGRTRDATGVFDMMQSTPNGSEPDDVTCLLVLQACANLGELEFGERVHKYIQEHGYGDALNLCNSLVAMYSRCGCLEKAYQVFKEMNSRDVVSWSAMISGFASNGYGREAIEAFREMQRLGVSPDDQTFTGVLSACSHSGLVDEGWMFFDCMSKEFGIVPNVHHYGCMVDLMGRAGLLDQAYELIISMGVKPDATIWRTLLGACRIHGHVTLGESVIGHLIQLNAQEAGDYVLLLNIYSSVGNWEKVTELRKLMKEKAIHTTPGCSTVNLKGEVHEFVVDDNSHPRKDEIYEMLDEIGKQLKIAGYVPEITSELHNLGAEEKETRLCYHSEKLAIAFVVLATPPGTTIRVAKNLRICVDCHNFAKVLSGVYNRKVIIRDRTQFHHFREGHCSCNDYW